jgi:flagellar hook-associated protein 2
MGIQITGLASGLNWQNIVTELVAADRAPETQWKAQQTADQNQISSLTTLGSDLTALQTAADSLSTGTAFSARSATVADPTSGWSASASAGTATGQYVVNVTQLASTAILSGSSNVGAALSTLTDGSDLTVGTMNIATPITPGYFTVDGARVSIAQSDSLKDVFASISTATNGAVTGKYDPGTDTIQLTSTVATVPPTLPPSYNPIVLGAANDTSNFLAATELYNNNNTGAISSANPLGSLSMGATIADSGLKLPVTDVDSSGNGTFSINGTSIKFNVNTDTLQTIVGRINNAGAGVTATFNGGNTQFTLTNNSTGDTGISVSEASGGLLEAMGLNSTSTFAAGTNAVFTINNNGPFTSATNNLDASVDGINGLTIDATSTGPQTITVGKDTSGITTQINDLISAYNTVQTYITAQTQITTNSDGSITAATLAGNQDITGMGTDLQNLMFNSISGMTGSITALDSIGIGFTGTSPLLSVLDPTKLATSIADSPDQISALFTGYPNGLGAQLDAYVAHVTSPDGVIGVQTTDLTQQSSSITDQISTLESQLTQEQTQLTTEFTNMETAESQYQSELTTLNSILGTGTTSSSTTSSSQTQQNANANVSSTSTSTTG